MTLIKSISGIRGTIGGKAGEGLTPYDLVKFTAAFGDWLQAKDRSKKLKMVVGRDARISGEMVRQIVCGTLMGKGIDVVDLDLSTTPTVEVMVTELNADGGIILTASHNPKHWNALKLVNAKGEFISAVDGAEVLDIALHNNMQFADVDSIGSYSVNKEGIDIHIQKVLDLDMVDIDAIKKRNFKVAVDCVNSTGGISIVPLLKALGVEVVYELYTEPNGIFPHNPEPLPEHLTEIAALVREKKADLGIVVDPDVDRLALVCEDGSMFGEEYTLVAVADYVLGIQKGNTVSNLSSSRALMDVTMNHGGKYQASAVGEVNVVEEMRLTNAIIGGEGNGGIILPALHYGRDALVGVALFLSKLAKSNMTCSELRKTYPSYFISKNKIELTPGIDVDCILESMKKKYAEYKINDIDGVRIDFMEAREWVHLRKSNTEPIIRIYAESQDEASAKELANRIIEDIRKLI